MRTASRSFEGVVTLWTRNSGIVHRELASGNGDRTAHYRMYKLGFSITWTVLTALGVWFIHFEPDWQDQEAFVKIILTAMPLAGLPFIWDSLRKLRRFRSVRTEMADNKTVYFWIELDGSESSSTIDPRIAWDSEDRNFSDN